MKFGVKVFLKKVIDLHVKKRHRKFIEENPFIE